MTDYDESEDNDKEARAIAGSVLFWGALVTAGIIAGLVYACWRL